MPSSSSCATHNSPRAAERSPQAPPLETGSRSTRFELGLGWGAIPGERRAHVSAPSTLTHPRDETPPPRRRPRHVALKHTPCDQIARHTPQLFPTNTPPSPITTSRPSDASCAANSGDHSSQGPLTSHRAPGLRTQPPVAPKSAPSRPPPPASPKDHARRKRSKGPTTATPRAGMAGRVLRGSGSGRGKGGCVVAVPLVATRSAGLASSSSSSSPLGRSSLMPPSSAAAAAAILPGAATTEPSSGMHLKVHRAPLKRSSLSKFYANKSRSFTCMAGLAGLAAAAAAADSSAPDCWLLAKQHTAAPLAPPAAPPPSSSSSSPPPPPMLSFLPEGLAESLDYGGMGGLLPSAAVPEAAGDDDRPRSAPPPSAPQFFSRPDTPTVLPSWQAASAMGGSSRPSNGGDDAMFSGGGGGSPLPPLPPQPAVDALCSALRRCI